MQISMITIFVHEVLQFRCPSDDVVVELRRDLDVLFVARAKIHLVLDLIRIEALLLEGEFFEFEGAGEFKFLDDA